MHIYECLFICLKMIYKTLVGYMLNFWQGVKFRAIDKYTQNKYVCIFELNFSKENRFIHYMICIIK